MSIAFEAEGLTLAQQERRSVSSRFWLVVFQIALLAIAIPGAIVVGALLP